MLRNAFANYELVIIDEAQTIPDVGKGLKLLADHLPQLRIIASGSSSLFKWSERRKTKVPAAWRGAYPEAGFEIVTPGNFLSFVL